MIPKTIHYCWFGGNPFSPLTEKCFDSWKEHLPGYQIKRWDETNSPIDQCLFARGAYKQKRWAFVADWIRCYALYHEGGIYMDTDMFVLKSLDPLLYHEGFLGWETAGWINCAILGAQAKHPFLQEMLQQYAMLPTFNRGKKILIPKLCSDILYKKGIGNENSIQEVFGMHLYPKEYFYPYPFSVRKQEKEWGFFPEQFMPFVVNHSFAVHLWDWSWRSARTCFRHRHYKEGFRQIKRSLCNGFIFTKLAKVAARIIRK